jgi:rhodanese-related sulfurtransferase
MPYLLAVLVVFTLIYLKFNSGKNSLFDNVDNAGFKDLLENDKNTVVLDVRTANEYSGGKIGKAINIDVMQSSFASKTEPLDKKKTYIVYCKSGMRSERAATIMCKMGFENVHNLKGGYSS